jgi:hypothetical protein
MRSLNSGNVFRLLPYLMASLVLVTVFLSCMAPDLRRAVAVPTSAVPSSSWSIKAVSDVGRAAISYKAALPFKDMPLISTACPLYSATLPVGEVPERELGLLKEHLMCEMLQKSRTFMDCANGLSLWENEVSQHYLTLPEARPVENAKRQRFTQVLLGAWAFYFAQCRDKARGVPTHYRDEVEWLERKFTAPNVSAPSSLRLFNWDGLRFAVGSNVCWRWGPKLADENFYMVVNKGEKPEPFPTENIGTRNQVQGNMRWQSRFMRNPILWRAYSDADRLYKLEQVLEVDDREAFLRQHMVNSSALSWFIGCAWGQHVPHATEPLFAALNLHLLLPSIKARTLTSVCSSAGDPKVPGSHHMIKHMYLGVGQTIERETGAKVAVAMQDEAKLLYGEGKWHCFPNAAFGGLTFLPRCNGPYAHPLHGAKLRESIVHQVLGPEHRPKSTLGDGIALLYLERVTTRKIRNKDALLEALRGVVVDGVTVTLTPVVFDQMPLADQIRHVQRTDVVLAPHGQGLLNFLWFEPNSAAIEMFAPNWHTTDFSNPVVAGGSFYFPYKHIEETPASSEDCCSKCCTSNMDGQYGYNALLEGCNDSRNCDILVKIDEVVRIVRRAIATVLREKYGRGV